MKRKSFLASIFGQRCPRCRQGKLFTHRAYDLRKFMQMHEKCSCCNLHYMLEPSFFEGAMYVSYAMQVAIFITTFIAINVLYGEAPVWAYVGATVGTVVLLSPLLFRLSRTIWIHFFIRYRHDAANCVVKSEVQEKTLEITE